MQQQNMSGLQAKQASAREKHGCCGPCVACCLGACACCCLEDIMCAGKYSPRPDKDVQSADLFRFAFFLLQQNVSIAFSKRCKTFSTHLSISEYHFIASINQLAFTLAEMDHNVSLPYIAIFSLGRYLSLLEV